MAGEPSPALLEWRIKHLEILERSVREELHELRHEVPERTLKSLRKDYYTKAETRNRFVTRAEVKEQRAIHRQWPMVISSIAVAIIGLVNLILLLSGGH